MYYRLKGPGTETERQTKKIALPTVKARSIPNVRERNGKPNGGVIGQNMHWRDTAHSNSEDSIRTRNHANIYIKTKSKTRGREAACEISPTLNALKETQNA